MTTIRNPIIPGMAPDPSIIRVDDVYYIATSTFHWNPGIQIFKSSDLANWEHTNYVIKNGSINLRGINTPGGIWAPHLSYDSSTKKYWLAFSHMINMAGREFNADSYVMWAADINGPWSDQIYITSIGFDPAIFHDEDGKHYITILEWETRQGYQAPGHIVIAEFDLNNGEVIGKWHRVTQGFTSRGCAEAPQIYKNNGYYYLILSAGGTGYAHGVEIGRSKNIFGPYEPHPSREPIITSSPRHLFSLGDPDAGHFEMYNPNSIMQKAGHGSLVQTQTGEWYMAHLMSRPINGTLLNPLGRETSIQKMKWTEDDWLEKMEGTNLAQMEVESMQGVQCSSTISHDILDHFEEENYDIRFMTPYRHQNVKWVNTKERKGHLRIRGENSLFSQMNPAIMATRATSIHYEFQTKIEFNPDHYSETAGMGLYYDSNNWVYAHLTHSELLGCTALSLLQAKQGERIEFVHNVITAPKDSVELKIVYDSGVANILYRFRNEMDWQKLADRLDVLYLSDEGINSEPGEIGGFTGLFNFIGSVDSHQHDSFADFDYYQVKNY